LGDEEEPVGSGRWAGPWQRRRRRPRHRHPRGSPIRGGGGVGLRPRGESWRRRRTWSGEIGERGSLAAAAEKTRESRSGIAGTGGEGRNRAEASTDASGGHEASGGWR